MTAAERLATILEDAELRLANISDSVAAQHAKPGQWSKKQILGHLIDSASNNHQRFVRALIAPRMEFPEYQQESWVAAQSYATEAWPDLVNLWLLFNRHLLHIIQAVPEPKLSVPCVIGSKEPMPLSALIDWYVDHLEHHLESIMGAKV